MAVSWRSTPRLFNRCTPELTEMELPEGHRRQLRRELPGARQQFVDGLRGKIARHLEELPQSPN
jgi:hypothetical protein